MPKSRKRRQKPAKGRTRGPIKQVNRGPAQVPTFGDFHFTRGLVIGHATEDDWQALWEAFLGGYPVCPDCETPWELDTATEEEGTDLDGRPEISITVLCPAYADDQKAGRQPQPHRRGTDDGMIHYALAVA